MTHIYYPVREKTMSEELEAKCAAREKLILSLAGDKIDLVSELAGVKGELEKALLWLHECAEEIDSYIWHEYPGDLPAHARYRKVALATNPARIAIAELKG